jgi:hypothetical protein
MVRVAASAHIQTDQQKLAGLYRVAVNAPSAAATALGHLYLPAYFQDSAMKI